MKSLKTKVILSAFVLLFALVATIGSTYAWFTVSSTVSVDTISIDVTTQDSLLIRLYGGESQGTADAWVATDYSQTITSTDLSTSAYYNGGAGGNIGTATLFPMTAASSLTTANGTDYGDVDPTNLAYVDITDLTNRALTSGSANTSAGGYFELKFWVMSQSVNHTITVQDLSISTSGSTAVADAVSLGTIEDDTPANVHVFANDPDYAFAFTATDPGFITQDASHENGDSSDWNSVAVPGTLVTANSEYYVESGAVADVSTATLGSASVIANLVADQVELVTVRIWIEGWDAESTNLIIAETFTISFKFVIND